MPRFALYDALHLPRPASPAAEREMGETATLLLWRGEAPDGVRHTDS